MKRLTLCLVLMLALLSQGGCPSPDKRFVESIDRSCRDYIGSAAPVIERDPTLTPDRKRALKALGEEILKTIDTAKEVK